jgi:hypothetical protein
MNEQDFYTRGRSSTTTITKSLGSREGKFDE